MINRRLALFLLLAGASASEAPLLVKPMLQLGYAPREGSLTIEWQAAEPPTKWDVEFRQGGAAWKKAEVSQPRRIAVSGITPHLVYRAELTGLTGGEFEYRLLKAGEKVFSAKGRARKTAGQPYRFVVFGDSGDGSAEQREVAVQEAKLDPDFVLITGDIVYKRGRISEYRQNFFPIYNFEKVLFVAAPGNHDVATRDLTALPDSLAYYYYWTQPLNGPVAPAFSWLKGEQVHRDAFLASAADAFPRMANFSFEYGNAHWTVLDSNPHADWSDAALRKWVADDIASAKNAEWRFVAFHHPGFNSSKEHFGDQQMRVLCDVFEAAKVDVVFSGHVHNYQRTYPLRFKRQSEGPRTSQAVPGAWTLDRTFDGVTKTRPDGVIYITTGGGGAHLYNPEQQDQPQGWQPFTAKYFAKVNSLTVADVNDKTLRIRQISKDGADLDAVTITK